MRCCLLAPPPRLGWLLVGVLVLGLVPPAAGQTTGKLRGKVVDTETGETIAAALIKIKNGGAPVTADSAGAFTTVVAPGPVVVTVTALGYESRTWKIDIAAGQDMQRTFGLDFTGEKLPEIVVTARADKLVPRYADFERRRQKGSGAYLRWDVIKQKNFNTVGEAARSIRGVKLNCDQRNFECYIYMARDPNCPATWWVDGVQVHSFTESTPIRDVYGLEFYRGPSEVPAEFTGSTAGCGVIVVWTKSKPYQ